MLYYLLAAGIALIVLNLRAIRKEENSFSSILNEKQEVITETEVEIGELRREFSETILELQKEIIRLEEEIEELKDKDKIEISVTEENTKAQDKSKRNNIYQKMTLNSENVTVENVQAEVEQSISTKTGSTSEKTSNSIKINEVGALLDKGASIEDICNELKIGKGEVLLIKELYLK